MRANSPSTTSGSELDDGATKTLAGTGNGREKAFVAGWWEEKASRGHARGKSEPGMRVRSGERRYDADADVVKVLLLILYKYKKIIRASVL